MNRNEVIILTSTNAFQPYLVLDLSQSTITTDTEQVAKLEEGMELIEERYNPFQKRMLYVVRKDRHDYKVVLESSNWQQCLKVAKQYAKANGLNFTR